METPARVRKPKVEPLDSGTPAAPVVAVLAKQFRLCLCLF